MRALRAAGSISTRKIIPITESSEACAGSETVGSATIAQAITPLDSGSAKNLSFMASPFEIATDLAIHARAIARSDSQLLPVTDAASLNASSLSSASQSDHTAGRRRSISPFISGISNCSGSVRSGKSDCADTSGFISASDNTVRFPSAFLRFQAFFITISFLTISNA